MLLAAPIFSRELIAFLRRFRAFGLLFFYLVILTAVALIVLAITAEEQSLDRTTASRTLFLSCAYVQIVLFTLLALSMTCRQISGERIRRTFDMLVTAPMRSAQLLMGKALASVGYLFLLALAPIPLFSLCMLLGGVGWWDIFILVYITMLSTITYAVVGVAASCKPRAKQAYQRPGGFGVFLLFHGGLPLLVGCVGSVFGGVPAIAIVFAVVAGVLFFLLCPPAAFALLTTRTAMVPGFMAFFVSIPIFLLCFTLAQAAAVAFFLRRACKDLAREAVLDVPAPGLESRKSASRPKDLLARVRQFPVPRWLNAVAAKDVSLAIPAKHLHRTFTLFLAVGLFLVGAWFILSSRRALADDADRMFGVLVLVVGAVSILGVYYRAAVALVSECEAKTSGLLAITLVNGRDIVWGKLLAAVAVTCGAVAAVVLPLVVVYGFCHPRFALSIFLSTVLGIPGVAASGLAYGAMGLWVTANARTTRAAGNWATAHLLLWVLLLLLATGGIHAWLSATHDWGASPWSPQLAESVIRRMTTLVFPAVVALSPAHKFVTSEGRIDLACFVLGVVASLLVARAAIGRAAELFMANVVREQERQST